MNIWLAIAAINGFLAVAAGAFGTGLQGRIDAHAIGIFETGARYHMYHALAIAVAALIMRGTATAAAQSAAGFFLGGIVLFCGSLYALSLTGIRWLGIITPVGGLVFLIGWAALAFAAFRMTPL